MSQSTFMEAALLEARMAEQEGDVPVGAVIVRNNVILARGYNVREKLNNPIGHAEIEALLKASMELESWRLTDCELYVTLEPCPMCLAACQQARLKRVVYGSRDLKGGAISLGYKLHEDQRTNHRFEVVLEESPECGKVLSEFFRKKRQIHSV